MDQRTLRERRRQKKRQMMIRRYTKLGIMAAAVILVVIFAVRGVIMPIMNRGKGTGSSGDDLTAQTEQTEETRSEDGEVAEVTEEVVVTDSSLASRMPLKGASDGAKVAYLTPGWHDDDEGRWYQNVDGTYFADGFQEINGSQYSFDENGYMQTGWVESGANEYYFNDDGSYNPDKRKPMLALTFDDGPSEYTSELLDCLAENGAHVTFFMLGECVEVYPDMPAKMLETGCELGNHSWDHSQLTSLDYDSVASQFSRTDNAVLEACGQVPTVARCPYGSGSSDIFSIGDRPFFMWSLDTEDWRLMDVDADYNAVMNGDLTDGSIILMHDIHQPFVQASLRLIPDLIAAGYKLVTVSELAAAKGVNLQVASYSDFWDSSLSAGLVPGYEGASGPAGTLTSGSSSEEEITSGDEDYSEDEDYSDEEYYDEDYSEEEYLDDSSDEEYYDEDYSEEY